MTWKKCCYTKRDAKSVQQHYCLLCVYPIVLVGLIVASPDHKLVITALPQCTAAIQKAVQPRLGDLLR